MSGDRRHAERRIGRRTEAPAMPVSLRRDLVKICAVEMAIQLQDSVGTRAAANYLNKHMVQLDVALRVLLHPTQRRRYAG